MEIFDAYDAEITTWGRANLVDVEDGDLGLKGSPTKIAKASDKVRKGAGEKLLQIARLKQLITSWISF